MRYWGTICSWAMAVATGTLAACAAPAPAPEPAPVAPLRLSAIRVEGVPLPPEVEQALAKFTGEALTPALGDEVAELLRDYLGWAEWREVAIETGRRDDGTLDVHVAARAPIDPEPAPQEYFDIQMPFPADPIPVPDGGGGARIETALDDSFKPWLASKARAMIDAADRRIYVKRDDAVISYAVAVGTPRTPTPAGDYWVEAITRHPTWYPPASIRREHAAKGTPLPAFVPPGHGNPLGLYFVRLQNSLGIHGTNQPRSIGKAASHGCIRMHDRDVAELVTILKAGDFISVVRNRAQATVAAALK
jgi:lipoprotein-anchoring transpeptidase ErfK/SrfK